MFFNFIIELHLDQTAVFIETMGFENPPRYTNHLLNKSDINGIGKWINGSGPNFFKVKV